MGRCSLRSLTGTLQLRVTADRTHVKADGQSLVWLDIAIVDGYGTPCRSKNVKISVETEHICLQALGTDRMENPEDYAGNACNTYLGRAQAILRAGTESGLARAIITAEGIGQAEIPLTLEENYEIQDLREANPGSNGGRTV